MFLGILGTTLLGNMFLESTAAGKIRAREGIIRAGLCF